MRRQLRRLRSGWELDTRWTVIKEAEGAGACYLGGILTGQRERSPNGAGKRVGADAGCVFAQSIGFIQIQYVNSEI